MDSLNKVIVNKRIFSMEMDHPLKGKSRVVFLLAE